MDLGVKMFEKWYTLDPGSDHILLSEKESFVEVHSLIAYKNNEVVAVSNDAIEYVYHRNASIKVKCPLQEGKLIGDVSPLIEYGLSKIKGNHFLKKPCLLICLVQRNEQEQQKWMHMLSQTGIRKFEFISISELMNEKIHFYIHAGHSCTLIGLNINGKNIFQKMISFAGKQMDEQIVQMVLKKYKCFVSMEDAQVLKEASSKNLEKNKNAKLSCFAMNKYKRYEKITITSMDVWPCIESIEKQIVLWTKQMISSVSLEIQEKILENGIYLSGGLANCFGLAAYLKHELHCPIICTDTPQYDMMNKMKGLIK